MSDPVAVQICEFLFNFFWLVLSLSVHEWGHAFVATKFGDPTPRIEGRLTLNPLAHISFIGTIIIPLIMAVSSTIRILGWARPVMVNPYNFKRRNLGDFCCSIAGPLMNLLFAVVLVFIGVTLRHFGLHYSKLFYIGALINTSLFLFNLIPLPPLDGGHIVKIILRMSEETFLKFSQIGMLILIVLINMPFFDKYFWLLQRSLFKAIRAFCGAIF